MYEEGGKEMIECVHVRKKIGPGEGIEFNNQPYERYFGTWHVYRMA